MDKDDKTNNNSPSWVSQISLKLSEIQNKFHDYEFPQVSCVIPTYNCAEKLSLTLDSVLEQNYPKIEVILIDATSTDRTLEVAKTYRDERIKVYSVSGYNRYEMLNKGISQASGQYINFLFPGDFYIYNETLKFMMGLALEHEFPNLLFCGTLLRDGKTEVKILYRHLSTKLLSKGQQPTSLQSIWFKNDTFKAIGKFDTSYTLRGGYELLCRFSLHHKLPAMSTNRVLTDYDLRQVTKEMVVRHFLETFWTVYKYFGIFKTIRWLFTQKDLKRMIKLWLKNLKVAFLGR